ncbi:hypothetical protein BS50DRAFT_589709 [Corynespora cassiicola Philippines]|uniref:Uncharacterized protein n=1 Tax=Corynespora cassiicola Philippines TaxID=1448308 RepID=A0A2T2NIV2_CORCC|nr:hypothetical protein BS50DRAFT_589709 [Corynespora cassiicola Philippines]
MTRATKSTKSQKASTRKTRGQKASKKARRQMRRQSQKAPANAPETSASPVAAPVTTNVTFADFMSDRFVPIQEPLTQHLSSTLNGAQLFTIGQESGYAKPYFKEAMASGWNEFLGNFFRDPTEFRNVQAETDSLLTGNAVRRFINRASLDTLETVTLEVVVSEEKATPMAALFSREGYTHSYNEQIRLDNSRFEPGEHMVSFRPPFNPEPTFIPYLVLRIVPMPPIVSILETERLPNRVGYANEAATFVSWNKIYLLYQMSTFVSLAQSNKDIGADDFVDGVNLIDHFTSAQQPWDYYTRERWVGDTLTYKLSLDAAEVKPSQMPDQALESVNFVPHAKNSHGEPHGPMIPGLLTSPVLKSAMIVPQEVYNHPLFQDLENILRNTAWDYLNKLMTTYKSGKAYLQPEWKSFYEEKDGDPRELSLQRLSSSFSEDEGPKFYDGFWGFCDKKALDYLQMILESLQTDAITQGKDVVDFSLYLNRG